MLRRILYGSLVLLLAFLVAMAWYVSSKGFTRKWRNYIVEEFRKAGVEVHIKRLTLDPFRGLVAKEVTVHDARDRKRVLAWVDEMLLGVNYASAMRGETFLDSADLRDANLWLPLDPKNPDGQRIPITKLNARLYLPPKQVYLARAQAEVHGIQVFASGRVINPQAFQPSSNGQEAFLKVGADILEELEKLKYGNPPPSLTVEFSGDLAHPDQVQATLRFEAHEVRRKNYELRRVGLVASCRKGIVELQQLHAVDARGELRATGTYDLATHEIALRAQSTLHLEEMEKAFRWVPHLEEWELNEPPRLELQIAGVTQPEWALRVTGHASMRNSSYQHVPFQQLDTNFSWESAAWSLREFVATHASGELKGDVTCQPGDFRARLESTVNPRALSGLFRPETAEWLSRFDFSNSPTLQLEVRGKEPTLGACHATGQLTYDKVLYRGQPAAPARSKLEYAAGVLSVAPFSMAQEATAGGGVLQFDFSRHEVRLDKTPTTQPLSNE